MNNYNKGNKFGGGRDFRGGGGRDFGGDRRPVEMHQATCAGCHKTCEVPFRPNGKKPVYCQDCFAKNGGPDAGPRDSRDGRDFAPKRSFDTPRSFDSAPAPRPQNDDIKRQLESINSTLLKLVSIVEALVTGDEIDESGDEEIAEEIVEKTATPKKSKKKGYPKNK